jgi:hypothetical protein
MFADKRYNNVTFPDTPKFAFATRISQTANYSQPAQRTRLAPRVGTTTHNPG